MKRNGVPALQCFDLAHRVHNDGSALVALPSQATSALATMTTSSHHCGDINAPPSHRKQYLRIADSLSECLISALLLNAPKPPNMKYYKPLVISAATIIYASAGFRLFRLCYIAKNVGITQKLGRQQG